jgi:hypothetical protein
MKPTYKEHKNYLEVFMNNIKIGELIKSEDGYFNWWADKDKSGYLPSYVLRDIANTLDSINRPWNDQVMKDIG